MTEWSQVEHLEPGEPIPKPQPLKSQTASLWGSQSPFHVTKYRAVLFTLGKTKPKGLRQRWIVLWGTDIWFGKFPLIKIFVGLNVALWIGLVVSR